MIVPAGQGTALPGNRVGVMALVHPGRAESIVRCNTPSLENGIGKMLLTSPPTLR